MLARTNDDRDRCWDVHEGTASDGLCAGMILLALIATENTVNLRQSSQPSGCSRTMQTTRSNDDAHSEYIQLIGKTKTCDIDRSDTDVEVKGGTYSTQHLDMKTWDRSGTQQSLAIPARMVLLWVDRIMPSVTDGTGWNRLQ